MAYEWKFKPRPYTDEEAKKLLANVVSPETTDWHYNTHHKGYVTALNNIEKGLETADRSGANGNFQSDRRAEAHGLHGITPERFFTICIGKFSAATAILPGDRK